MPSPPDSAWAGSVGCAVAESPAAPGAPIQIDGAGEGFAALDRGCPVAAPGRGGEKRRGRAYTGPLKLDTRGVGAIWAIVR